MDYQEESKNLHPGNVERPQTPDNTSWGITPDRDPRAVGNKAVSTPESHSDIDETPHNLNQSPELGQIVNLEMPPGMELQPHPQTSETTPETTEKTNNTENNLSPAQRNLTSIRDRVRRTGKISSHEAKTVESLARDLSPAELNDAIRGAD